MSEQAVQSVSSSEIPWAIIENGKIIAEIGTTVRIPLSFIQANKDQPRKFFDPSELLAIAESYAHRKDVEQAVHVTLRENGSIALIVDGENRYRAAKMKKLEGISCYIRPPMDDDEVYLSSAVSNIRRRGFSIIEIALSIFGIQERFKVNQTEAGKKLGMSPSQVAYHLKFLDLTEEIQLLLMEGKIGAGISFQLAKFKQDDQKKMLKRIKDAVKENDGRPIHPNKVARILRNEAERRNINPQQGARGRAHASHAQLVGKHVVKTISNAKQALKELKEVGRADLQKLTNPHPLDLQNDLLDLQKQIAVTLRQFDHIT